MSINLLFQSYVVEGQGDEKSLLPPFNDLNQSELAVCRWLLWRYNDETGRCNPSHEDIRGGTGLSVSTIERALRSLKKKTLIDWTPRWGNGQRLTNDYDLSVNLTGWDKGEPVNRGESTRQTGPSQPVTMAEEHRSKEQEDEQNKEQELRSTSTLEVLLGERETDSSRLSETNESSSSSHSLQAEQRHVRDEASPPPPAAQVTRTKRPEHVERAEQEQAEALLSELEADLERKPLDRLTQEAAETVRSELRTRWGVDSRRTVGQEDSVRDLWRRLRSDDPNPSAAARAIARYEMARAA